MKYIICKKNTSIVLFVSSVYVCKTLICAVFESIVRVENTII